MSKYNFQLTYSVHPRDHEDIEHKRSADKARRLFKDISNWQVIDKIETTLVGELHLLEQTLANKRSEAQTAVITIIRNLIKEHDIYYSVDVYMSLMVSGLGEHIEFNI